jgi:hypothetical protein
VEGRECEEGAVVGGAEGAAEGEEGEADEGAEGTAECAAWAEGSAGREEGSCWTESRMEGSCCVGTGLKLMVEEVGGGARPRMEVAGLTTALLKAPPSTPEALLTTVAGLTTALSAAPPSTPEALLTTVAGLTTAAAALLDEDDGGGGEATGAHPAWGGSDRAERGGALLADKSPIWTS